MLPIGRTREGRYLLLFSVQMLVCLGLLTWYEVSYQTGDGVLATVIAIGQGMSAFVVVVTATTVVIVEGSAMLAERYLKRRYEAGKAEGRDEGRAEGRANEAARWRAWNARRVEAEREGRPFDEPPPGENSAPPNGA